MTTMKIRKKTILWEYLR